jgi:hypothetical protein
MSETTFPRRDADGRVVRLPELLVWIVAGLVLGVIALLVVDALSVLVGMGRFGQISGWLAGILPVWLFVEEFRAWHAIVSRVGMALLCGLLALVIGVAGSSLAAGVLPPLGSGAVGVTITAMLYGTLWYVGIRWLANRGAAR